MAYRDKETEKSAVIRRYNADFDRTKYEYRPASIQLDSFREDDYQRVAVYARVSTDDVSQTSSFELQKRYYEQLVQQHEKWVLIGIFADEGKSGTTTAHRDGFNEMINLAMKGRIDLIIVKSVSRFARNIVDCLLYVRQLKEKGVGVFFESENVYSMNEEKNTTLEMMAFMAENESQIRRRGQIASYNMRSTNGIPSTPELYGYIMGENGRLVRDPETWLNVKLIFSMYMFGYTTAQIVQKLEQKQIKSPGGIDRWQEGTITKILRSERYCGDVLTWKTFTVDVTSHKTRKNRGERPQCYYKEWHDAIISRDDFIAIQHMLDNAKYKHIHLLPELRVIAEGLLKGYVIINPRWRFSTEEYRLASRSVGDGSDSEQPTYEAKPGEFDLSGFSVVDAALTSPFYVPRMMIQDDSIRFSSQCFRRMPTDTYVELLIHPGKKCFAVRPTSAENKNAVKWANVREGKQEGRPVSCKAFIHQMMELFGWDVHQRYSLQGRLYGEQKESVFIFSAQDASMKVRVEVLSGNGTTRILNNRNNYVLAIPEHLAHSFGRNYYAEQILDDGYSLPQSEWKLNAEGESYEARLALKTTPYEEIEAFVQEQLGGLFVEGEAQS